MHVNVRLRLTMTITPSAASASSSSGAAETRRMGRMGCTRDERLSAYLARGLPDGEARSLEEHLEVCGDCADVVAALRDLSRTDPDLDALVATRELRAALSAPPAPLAPGTRIGRYEIAG